VTNYKPILAFPFVQSPPTALADARHSSGIHTLRHLTGSVSPSALRAEPPKNELAFAKNPLTKEARGRPGHVAPLNVLNIAAAVADEVVMPHAFRIESRGTALDGHFTHQTRPYQVPEIVISRGP
jgi:hypothetical protein